MTAEEFKSVIDFERSLKVGDTVIVHWTTCHRFMRAKATVEKINDKSIVTCLIEEVHADRLGSWPIGHKIKVPRLGLKTTWSANNRAWPVDKERNLLQALKEIG